MVAHNNTPYLDFAKDDLAVRFAPGRLPNVERLLAENNQLTLPAGRFDAVLMTNVYHDIYFVDEKAGWPRIDGPKLLAEVFRSLKPGGVLGVTDHAALPGSPPETGGTLHRIDPALLKREITAAGFVLEAESDVLVNPDGRPDEERLRSVRAGAHRPGRPALPQAPVGASRRSAFRRDPSGKMGSDWLFLAERAV